LDGLSLCPAEAGNGLVIYNHQQKNQNFKEETFMEFFTSAIDTLQILVIALGAGLGAWGVINLLEGYGNDNPGANGQGA